MHGGNYFNENKKSIIRSNIEKYAWAKELAAQTTEKADRMLKFGKRFWWTLPTPPRASEKLQPLPNELRLSRMRRRDSFKIRSYRLDSFDRGQPVENPMPEL